MKWATTQEKGNIYTSAFRSNGVVMIPRAWRKEGTTSSLSLTPVQMHRGQCSRQLQTTDLQHFNMIFRIMVITNHTIPYPSVPWVWLYTSQISRAVCSDLSAHSFGNLETSINSTGPRNMHLLHLSRLKWLCFCTAGASQFTYSGSTYTDWEQKFLLSSADTAEKAKSSEM